MQLTKLVQSLLIGMYLTSAFLFFIFLLFFVSFFFFFLNISKDGRGSTPQGHGSGLNPGLPIEGHRPSAFYRMSHRWGLSGLSPCTNYIMTFFCSSLSLKLDIYLLLTLFSESFRFALLFYL